MCKYMYEYMYRKTVLNFYSSEGQGLKSTLYSNANLLPRIFNFENTDTL